jgi:hypothetical protein
MANFEINRGNNNCIPISGIGNIIIPEDADATEYVQRCYRNHSISISGGYASSAMHNVRITEEALNDIQFPSGDKDGSAVVWIRDSFYNRPVVIGVLKPVEIGSQSNNYQRRIFKEAAQQITEIFMDALDSSVNITALGSKTKPANIVVKASSGNDEGDEIDLISKDIISLCGKRYVNNITDDFNVVINDGEKEILSIIGNKDEYHIKDYWGNDIIMNEQNTQILTNKFNVGEGKEQMVLGNTLVDLLSQLIDAILNMTVLTHVGPSGTPLNASVFNKIKSDLETILSKLSNTD